MEPPTCTVLLRVVRTTAAVATWLLSAGDEAVPLLLLLAATATPPATTPPTRAPAMAAVTTTCRAENSAIAARPGAVARRGGHAGTPVLGDGTARLREGVVHSGRLDFDVSRG